MKYTMIRLATATAILFGAIVGNSANAGFGHLLGGGSAGASAGYGSSGGMGYGSSGGAGYGSSGGASYVSAGYGSSGGMGYGSSGGAGYSGYGSSGGGYVAAYGSSGGGSSGGAARPGLLSRLHTRVHSHMAAKHARHAAYGSSGGGSSGGYAGYGSSGGYAGYGSSGGSMYGGGSSGGYYSGYSTIGGGSSGGVSYGSTGSAGYGSTGSVMQSGYGSAGSAVPSPYYGTSTTSAAHTSALVSSSRSDDAVKLNVVVPESAKVYVNDRLTTSTGEVRQFVSRGLEAGKSYRFEIRAEINDNGKIVTDTQSIVATAGSQENVRFAMKPAPKADAKVDTAVVLNVPADAEVTLAGNDTQVKGTTRVFKTSQLKTGDVWDDYVIQVKVGDQVKTQSIRLIAGDKLELSFDFDSDANRLAAN